jgi:hypothetical protein
MICTEILGDGKVGILMDIARYDRFKMARIASAMKYKELQ